MVTITWSGDASDRVAVVLPGGGYTAQAPLLHWSAAALREQGWRVGTVAWAITAAERASPEQFVGGVSAHAFADVPATATRLVVGKSFGCHALPWALEHAVAGAWLTPVVTHAPVRHALAAAGTAHLAIGGDRDRMWTPGAVGPTSAALITVPGADHSLESAAGWEASIAMQLPVLARVAAHAAALVGR